MEKQVRFDALSLRPLSGVERGRLLLEVPEASIDIPTQVAVYAEENNFTPKDEHHLTVIGKRTQLALTGSGHLEDVMTLVNGMSRWTIASTGRFYVLSHSEVDDEGGIIMEESIIQLVDLPAMNELYDKIRQTTRLDIDTPPAHVTLYTKNADRGIGVYSQAQLAEYITVELS